MLNISRLIITGSGIFAKPFEQLIYLILDRLEWNWRGEGAKRLTL